MRVIDGEQVYDCPYCFESGVVEVANIWRTPRGGRPMVSFWTGKTKYLPVCVVACTCYRRSQMPNLPQLNVDTMFMIDNSENTEAAAQRFRDWWAMGYRHARVSDFDEWNDGRE